MRLWSRGLGKRELEMDFMRYEISRDGDDVVLSGRITEPVNWDFWIRFDEDDVPGLVRVAKSPTIIGLVVRRWSGKLFPFLRRKEPKEGEENGEAKEPKKPVTAARPTKAEKEAAEPVASGSRSGTGSSESE